MAKNALDRPSAPIFNPALYSISKSYPNSFVNNVSYFGACITYA